jgi:hypothetical protein
MLIRDIPPEKWNAFLDAFSRQHYHEPVTLERSDMQNGLRIVAHAALLEAITRDPLAHTLTVTVGESPSERVTQTIAHPDGIAVEEPEPGGAPRPVVHLMGAGQHLVVRVAT